MTMPASTISNVTEQSQLKKASDAKTQKIEPTTKIDQKKKKSVWQALYKFTRKKEHEKRFGVLFHRKTDRINLIN